MLSCCLRRPGFLSPSAGLKAVSNAYLDSVEFSGGGDDCKSGTPSDYASDELANGRLAMMAITCMFCSAWADWANHAASPPWPFQSELGVQAMCSQMLQCFRHKIEVIIGDHCATRRWLYDCAAVHA